MIELTFDSEDNVLKDIMNDTFVLTGNDDVKYVFTTQEGWSLDSWYDKDKGVVFDKQHKPKVKEDLSLTANFNPSGDTSWSVKVIFPDFTREKTNFNYARNVYSVEDSYVCVFEDTIGYSGDVSQLSLFILNKVNPLKYEEMYLNSYAGLPVVNEEEHILYYYCPLYDNMALFVYNQVGEVQPFHVLECLDGDGNKSTRGSLTLPQPKVNDNDRAFLGWRFGKDDENLYQPGETVVPYELWTKTSGEISYGYIFYAVYEKDPAIYTISYRNSTTGDVTHEKKFSLLNKSIIDPLNYLAIPLEWDTISASYGEFKYDPGRTEYEVDYTTDETARSLYNYGLSPYNTPYPVFWAWDRNSVTSDEQKSYFVYTPEDFIEGMLDVTHKAVYITLMNDIELPVTDEYLDCPICPDGCYKNVHINSYTLACKGTCFRFQESDTGLFTMLTSGKYKGNIIGAVNQNVKTKVFLSNVTLAADPLYWNYADIYGDLSMITAQVQVPCNIYGERVYIWSTDMASSLYHNNSEGIMAIGTQIQRPAGSSYPYCVTCYNKKTIIFPSMNVVNIDENNGFKGIFKIGASETRTYLVGHAPSRDDYLTFDHPEWNKSWFIRPNNPNIPPANVSDPFYKIRTYTWNDLPEEVK